MQRRDRRHRTVGVGTAQLHVLTGANAAGEIGNGTTQKTRAEVEAENESRVGHRLEEHRAVTWPVGALWRLAHKAGVLERPERERHRRLRDADAARDLGARDGRAGANRLEDGALVQVLEQGWGRAREIHLVKKINANTPEFLPLDSISAES